MAKFLDTYKVMQTKILGELPTFAGMDPVRQNYIKHLMDTCLGGKHIRGKLVCDVARKLKPLSTYQFDTEHSAAVCGWGVEFLQSFFLIEDDIMDSSLTRRDQPCWYRLPGVGFSQGINDGLIIESMMYRMVRKELENHPEKYRILDLFHDATYLTTLGQFYDVTSQQVPIHNVPRKPGFDINQFTVENYNRIVLHKTTYYTIRLPLSLSLAVTGTYPLIEAKELDTLSKHIGEYFQIQDDFLDCFGDPAVTGKIGTDIEEGKCTWLAASFLAKADQTQRERFVQFYGKKDPESVGIIKDMYRKAHLLSLFEEYEDKVGKTVDLCLKEHIRCQPFCEGVQDLWTKLYRRTK
eukprot:PhF_6_TR26598/c0_g1_i2/m.38490/K00787/FDPS; farnesyl diphosphate synthase